MKKYFNRERWVYSPGDVLIAEAASKPDALYIVDALNATLENGTWPTDDLVAATVDEKRALWLKDLEGDYSSSTYTAMEGVDTMEDVVACAAVPRVEWERWVEAAAYRGASAVHTAQFVQASNDLFREGVKLAKSLQ